MNFHPIAWHKECLENQICTARQQDAYIKDLQCRQAELIDKITFYKAQIIKAESEGKEAFDKDSYGLKKGVKRNG